MNLSFLEDSINNILTYSDRGMPPLEDDNSLLRVLEKLLVWACGLLKNLAKSEDNAKLICKTEIPVCLLDNIRNSTTPPNLWTNNSLEEFSLFVILNLAQWSGSKEALLSAGAADVIKPIVAEGYLQGLAVTMATALLRQPIAK